MSPEIIQKLRDHARETALLGSVFSVLGWDERTMLPEKGGGLRADQMTLLSGWLHQRRTDPQLGQWLTELRASPLAADQHSDIGATIRWLYRDYEKTRKVPQRLVEALTRATVRGQQVWSHARKNNDFAAFAPILREITELTRQKAQAIGYLEHPYDPMLDEYEPGMTAAEAQAVLAPLGRDLAALAAAISNAPRQPDVCVLARQFPLRLQKSFAVEAARQIGFDFSAGRLDIADHPFCQDIGPGDCRITTRYAEQYFPTAFFGVLHEAGHGMYEQGLRADQFGLPPGMAASLGIHESQSRLWENLVGRSLAFWRFFYPRAQSAFGSVLSDVAIDDFHFAINAVRPTLIRVEADEVTYNLHILIRFELEKDLLDDTLQVDDLPAAWNQKYVDYLGVTPPSDAMGVLQDIHWSAGLLGYFPTYALGNLYAAQFYEQMQADLGDLDALLAAGDFPPLLAWLREHIHRPGQCYSAKELVEHVTGRVLSAEPLMRHLQDNFGRLYQLG